MKAIGMIMFLAGFAGIIIGAVTLIHPIQRIRIPTRKLAGLVIGASFVVFVVGAGISPPKDKASKPIPSATAATTSAAQVAERVTATSKPSITPQVTVTPATIPLAPQVEKSIRDNKNAVTSGANLDNLQITFDPAEGLLTVSIRPNSPDKDTQFITNGSALSIISGKAIWTTYDRVQKISVQVYRGTKDSHGNLQMEQMAMANYERENGLKYNYGNLKNQSHDDNKLMYCTADFYLLSERVWNALVNKGCLSDRAGGANPSIEEQAFMAPVPTATPRPPTARPKPPTATLEPPTATPRPPTVSVSVANLLTAADLPSGFYSVGSDPGSALADPSLYSACGAGPVVALDRGFTTSTLAGPSVGETLVAYSSIDDATKAMVVAASRVTSCTRNDKFGTTTSIIVLPQQVPSDLGDAVSAFKVALKSGARPPSIGYVVVVRRNNVLLSMFYVQLNGSDDIDRVIAISRTAVGKLP